MTPREQWKAEAREHNVPIDRINDTAKAIYYSNWKELPTGRFPPVWESASDEVRDFVRAQAVRAITTTRTFGSGEEPVNQPAGKDSSGPSYSVEPSHSTAESDRG